MRSTGGGIWLRVKPVGTGLRACTTAAGLAAALVLSAPQMALADPAPFAQAVARYAPAGLHMEATAPVSVTVGGTPVDFQPTGTDGEYSGSVSGVTATVTFRWYAAAQALQWDIALANAGTSASPPIVVAPITLNLDADLAGSPKVVPCTKTYGGATSNFSFVGTTRSFDTTSVAATTVGGAGGTGNSSSVLQVAMNTQSTAPAVGCSGQGRSNLAGLYTGLSWSANWQFSAGWGSSASGTPPFVVTVSTDQATASNPLTLAGQETIDYPTVNLGFVTGRTWNDIENAQVNYVRTVLQPKLPGQQTASPVSYDSYFGVDGTPTLPFLRQQAKAAATLGVKYFTIDAGWYQTDGSTDTFPGLGNSLTPSISQYPQGQESLADFCKNYVPSLGMTCGIWLVPQATSSTKTDVFKLAPPDVAWAGDIGPNEYARVKLQLQDRAAQDWTVDVVDRVIKTYGIGWVRFETQTPGLFMSNAAPYTTLQYNNGVTKVFQKVHAMHPEVYIEGSQAGGQRMDFNTARLAHGDWTADFSINAAGSRVTQTRGLRLWPSSFLNLTDAGCTPAGSFGGLGCTQPGSGTNGINFDNVGDQFKVLSRMPGKLSLDGFISQWPAANVAKIRALVAAFTEVATLQEQPMTFPLGPAGSDARVSWDAVAFGGAASEAGVTPAYPASPGQALYVFRSGVADAGTNSFCLPNPANAANTFTLVSGPDGGGASIADAGPCTPPPPFVLRNYIPGGELFTVTLPPSSGALFLRNVSGAPTVPAPSNVSAVQNDETVRLSWVNGSGTIAGSEISRSSDGGVTWSVIAAVPGNATAYVDAGIDAYATYLYRVAAYDGSVINKSAPGQSPSVPVMVAGTTTRIFDTDPAIRYSASTLAQHVLSPMPNPYGTAHSITNGATAAYSCRQCAGLAWNSRPGLGAANRSATVTLTNGAGAVVETQTIDTAGPTLLASRSVYVSGLYYQDNYTLTITAAAGNTVELDSIDVTSFAPTLVDDAATPPAGDSLSFANAVASSNLSDTPPYFGATAHSGASLGTSFTYRCADCTQLAWWSHTGPQFGSATVTLDGVVQKTVSANAARVGADRPLYTTGSLPLGAHTLTITNAGGGSTEVDAFQVVRPDPSSVGSFTAAAGDPGWSTAGFTFFTPTTAPPLPAASFYRQQSWSTNATATDGSVKAAYSCSGCDRLQLVTGTAANLGIAVVKVTDEAGKTLRSGTVDLYSTSRQPPAIVFDSGLLSAAAGKRYTLTVTPSGSKNPASGGFWTEVQAVRVTKIPTVSAQYNNPDTSPPNVPPPTP